jgi:hypothetical protein
MCRFEPTSLIFGVERAHDAAGSWRHRIDELYRTLQRSPLFASIDHISHGRAAWNVLTSSRPKAALNFSLDRQMDHGLRYQRAEEFVDVVEGLGLLGGRGAGRRQGKRRIYR